MRISIFGQFKMADGCHIEIVNLQYLRNRSSDHDEIFHQYADCGCKNGEMLKFAYFKYSRWWTAAILGIENLQSVTVQPIGMKFCMGMQIGAANNAN